MLAGGEERRERLVACERFGEVQRATLREVRVGDQELDLLLDVQRAGRVFEREQDVAGVEVLAGPIDRDVYPRISFSLPK